MKKRIVMAIFALALFLAAVPFQCFAAEATDTNVSDEDTDSTPVTSFFVIREDDGSFMGITCFSSGTRASGTKNATKTYTYHLSDGTVAWEAALTGTFTYDAASSNCTSCGCTVTVHNNTWYLLSKSTNRSGDTAYAEVTMGCKVLGVTIATRTYNLSLTCDKNGNLS